MSSQLTRNLQNEFPKSVLEGRFEFVQNRLRGGAVYRSPDSYLRIGEREPTMNEESQTKELFAKGFPVAEVLEHGEIGNYWYFVEQSLGDKHFGQIFAEDTQEQGVISDDSFNSFQSILMQYAEASYSSSNLKEETESIRDVCLYERTKSEYEFDIERLERVISAVEMRLKDVPRAILNTDLGPYNILPRGVIDFEFLHSGPRGYDVYTAPLVCNFFARVRGFKHRQTFEFTPRQLKAYHDNIDKIATALGGEPPSKFANEFLVMKAFWAACRPFDWDGQPYANEEREKFFSHFRKNIVEYCVDCYDQGGNIDPYRLPDVGVSGEW